MGISICPPSCFTVSRRYGMGPKILQIAHSAHAFVLILVLWAS